MRDRLWGTHCIATAIAVFTACPVHADAPQTPFQLARDRGCIVCHDVETAPAGASQVLPSAPSFQAIARKYRGDTQAVSNLAVIVRQGTGPLSADRHWAGKVGFTSMFAHDLEVTDVEARVLVEWILSLERSVQRPPQRR